MKERIWVRSGVVEIIDKRQEQNLELVLGKIRFYYSELYQTKNRYKHPLSLKSLMKLTNRSGSQVLNAVRILANTVLKGEKKPAITYDRICSERNSTHRPYRIFLRQK